MIKILSMISTLLGLAFLFSTSAHSQPYYSLTLLGQPWHCSFNNGVKVPIFLDPSVNNVGVATAYPPRIVLNPLVMNRFSPTMQVFWLAHECSHATNPQPPHVNPESAADCIAIRQLRQFNLTHQELNQIAHETLPLLGGGNHTGHLPGPERAAQIVQCYFN